jgi:hypothetical protein
MHEVLDKVIAPVMYRMLFDNLPLDSGFARHCASALLDTVVPAAIVANRPPRKAHGGAI